MPDLTTQGATNSPLNQAEQHHACGQGHKPQQPHYKALAEAGDVCRRGCVLTRDSVPGMPHSAPEMKGLLSAAAREG